MRCGVLVQTTMLRPKPEENARLGNWLYWGYIGMDNGK